MQEPISTRRGVSAWLLVLGLALAALGQFMLAQADQRPAMGLGAYAASFVVLFVLVRSLRGTDKLTSVELRLLRLFEGADRALSIRAGLVLFACVAVLVADVIANSDRPSGAYWPAFYAWLLGLVALGIAFVILPERERWAALRRILVRERVEVLVVVGLVFAAFALRAIQLTGIPYPMAGDEGAIGEEARHVITGEFSNMFITGWQSESSMSFLPWAISMRLFGQNLFGLRILAATIGALTIVPLYLLVRSVFNRNLAMVSSALLAAMGPHIHFSRIAANNVWNAFFACLAFWLLYRATEARRVSWFAAAGIASGLALYTFVGSRLVLILAGVYLAYAFVTDRSLWKEWPKFLVFGLTAGLTILPLAHFFWTHQDLAYSRLNSVGIFQTGWIRGEAAQTHESYLQILARLTLNSFLLLVSNPASGGVYNSPQPLFDGLWSLFLVLGLIFSLFDLRERRHVLLQMWFWGVVLFAGTLIVPPPGAERYTMGFPVFAILVGVGLWNVLTLMADALNSRRLLTTWGLAIVTVVLVATNLNFYFLDYTKNHYYTDPNSEVGYELGLYLQPFSKNSKVYFLGEPRMFWSWPTLAFLTNDMEATDVPLGNNNVQKLLNPSKRAIFVGLPNRRDDLAQISEELPGGQWYERARPFKPQEPLFIVYTVDHPTP